MPELPEVETIRRELKPQVLNKKITKVKIFRPDVIDYPSKDKFRKDIVNKTITNLTRKGKYLIFHLSNVIARSVTTLREASMERMRHQQSHGIAMSFAPAMTKLDDEESLMIVHLRLSGQLLVRNSTERKAPNFEQVRFYLTGKKILSFVEPRVLGRVYLVSNHKYPISLTGLTELGLEPIDKKFDFEYLYSKLKGRKAPIKGLLLDQSITAGVGNIYSDEALFLAGIHPMRRANTLSLCEIKNLTKALKQVIIAGIKSKGTTVSDYLRPDGSEGKYQFRSFVFDREEEPCRICKTPIAIAKFGNRRTRFCLKCQPL